MHAHPVQVTHFVPKIRDSGFLARCMPTGMHCHPPPSLPFDDDGLLQFLIYQRESKSMGDGRYLNKDMMALKTSSDISSKDDQQRLQDNSELCEAFITLATAASNLDFELIGESVIFKPSTLAAKTAAKANSQFKTTGGLVLMVSARKDDLASSRLALPGFIEAMKLKLGCTDKDCLIAVPFKDNVVFATKASSPVGCCILADMVDAKDALAEDKSSGYICSVPFRVKAMDSGLPLAQLLAQGQPPVVWERWVTMPEPGTKIDSFTLSMCAMPR